MDGVEWRRTQWSLPAKAWLYMNERVGCLIGNHLIADHPEIANHLATRVRRDKITMIPYGADQVTKAAEEPIRKLGLTPGEYALVIARPEPDNSILEIVKAFGCPASGKKLVVLGRFDVEGSSYHRSVVEAASESVLFPGAIYDLSVTQSLRFHAALYVHGHRVGGTNPSLVEALGAGSPVLAHDNPFNRWVAGSGAHFFNNETDCAHKFAELLENRHEQERMRAASLRRFKEQFTWEKVLQQYRDLIGKFLPVSSANPPSRQA
ncbi:glycosyltransferase family protein [Desulfolithobacter dissulfuricans]